MRKAVVPTGMPAVLLANVATGPSPICKEAPIGYLLWGTDLSGLVDGELYVYQQQPGASHTAQKIFKVFQPHEAETPGLKAKVKIPGRLH